jgi:histidinol phosphatase-like PHP family hydrolase
MATLAKKARSLGAKLILVHGETFVEPVLAGTNKKALQCDIDILAHPGLITQEEATLSAKKNIYLEITTRHGHSYSNGHVARMAKLTGAKLLLNSDSHSPSDLLESTAAEKIAQGAGVIKEDILIMRKNAQHLIEKLS